jgi:geranylgeranyl diphosphate synthase type I
MDALVLLPSTISAWVKEMTDAAMRAAVDGLSSPIRHVVGYHLGWWSEDGHLQDAQGGKAIRPALLLSAEGEGSVVDAVPAAIAVELVHNFSLLHDDVVAATPVAATGRQHGRFSE